MKQFTNDKGKRGRKRDSGERGRFIMVAKRENELMRKVERAKERSGRRELR